MFEHSVKVPRHYKVAANIFKQVSTEGGSVKTLLYDEKLRHFRTNVLYALITETIKHSSDIDRIFEDSSLLKNEQRLDPWLAKILTAELLFGKKTLPGKSKPEQTILLYKEQFEKYSSTNQDILKTEVVRRPRYVRINTNLLTTSDAIGAFQDEGYRFVRCTSASYNDYLQQIQNLSEYDFTQDYHVKTIFVFPPGTKLHEHELYLENKIILQDKATALAVHLLAPPLGSAVLDMCAAPGMKTTQLAAFMRNQGKIIAVERNEKRYQTLCDFVEKTGSKCVETIHKDALEIKRGEHSDVEYILLDPSCSGSGMELSVHNYIDATRLAKLTSLQEKFLKHAMNSFPKAKRIVYSTCSILPEENERVVTNVVKTSRAKWRVQDVKELLKNQWNNFGSGMYGSMGNRCMYAKPDSDFTIGFFLAVLDRDSKDLEKSQNEYVYGKIRKNEKLDDSSCETLDVDKSELRNSDNENKEINPITVLKKKNKDKCLAKSIQSAPSTEGSVVLSKDQCTFANEQTADNNTKKKKKNKIPKEVSKTESHKDVNSINNIKDETLAKKKKKDINIADNEISSLDTEETDTSIKKKKKKKATQTESANEIQIYADINSKEDKITVKKRKKDIGIGIADDEINFLETDKVSKKKKKGKAAETETATEIQIDAESCHDEMIESHKRKKKKKRDKSVETTS